LLARLAEASRSELNRLLVRDACECVFYSKHQTMLSESFDISTRRYVRVKWEGKRT
jgi:hypothetical protein